MTRWFVLNPVAANLLVLLIIAGGVLTALSMRIEGFPKLPADTIQIDTLYPSASTEQVDRQITQKIEHALQSLPGVRNIRATSLEAVSSVHVQKVDGYSLQRLLDDVRLRLDGIAGFPQEANKPVVSRNDFDFPALIVQLYGDTDPATLQRLGRRVRDALLAHAEISSLKGWGEKKPEFHIEVQPDVLEKYKLSISDIVEKIQLSSLAFQAGTLKTDGGRISLRADSQDLHYQDFADIPVVETADGVRLLLGDLARIQDTFSDQEVIVRFNGQAALGMEVLIGRRDSLLDIAEVVRKTVDGLQTTLPEGVMLSVWADASHYISERLQLLKSNALQGLLLVFVLLALFLNLKLAFWVAMGIPVSVAGALAVMGSKWLDYSLNDITTFGLIIALGILVDDAVVVGESVFAERRLEKDPVVGTLNGVRRVATATIFGVLTTVAAFFPMMLINNALGKVLASFSGVVILALLFSLLESKFILPSHLARLSLDRTGDEGRLSRLWQGMQGYAQRALEGFRTGVYRPALEWSLQQRYAVAMLFVTFATLGLGLIYAGKIKTVFFPDISSQVITVNMEMDARAPYRLTLANADRIETIGRSINAELQSRYQLDEKPIRHILLVVKGAYSVDLYAELTPADQRRDLGTLDILRQWQDGTGRLEGAVKLTFSGSEELAGGFAIDLYSKNEDSLKAASRELMGWLRELKGVSNLREGLKNGKPELSLMLKPEARLYGFSNDSLARQIGQLFGGVEAQRIQRDGQEIKVIVQGSGYAADSIADLMQSRLKSDNGQWYPLLDVARIESAYSPDYIARRNGQRVNTIQADINKEFVAPAKISLDLFTQQIPGMEKRYPQVTFKMAGELEEMGKMQSELKKALVFTGILIFVLLAVPLKSYWQPLIIMSVVPFGFIGAAIGHLIMDMPLSILSFFGMLALTGVVVNDSLVMVTRYNQERESGHDIHHSLLGAGVGRFQAIFLTTVTTVAGLGPLMLETSEQAQYLIPAAVSLVWGEIFATAITLILVPVLIAISADMQNLFRARQLRH